MKLPSIFPFPSVFFHGHKGFVSKIMLFSVFLLHMSLSLFFQLNALSGENKHLRRQLEEERSMRLLPPPPPPPASQQCSSVHLPFSPSGRPSPLSHSIPSSLRLPQPLSLDTATGDTDRILHQTKLSGAGLERPGESQALGEAFRIKPTVAAFLEDAQSGRTSRIVTKWSPLRTLTCLDFLTSSSSPGSVLSMRLMSFRSKSSPRVLFAWGGPPEPANDGISSKKKKKKSTQKLSLLLWRHLFQEHIYIFFSFKTCVLKMLRSF